MGPSGLVRRFLNPRDLLFKVVLGPVSLDVDGFLHPRTPLIGEKFFDRIIALDRLVGSEYARNHRPDQPWQVLLTPDVEMRIDDSLHALPPAPDRFGARRRSPQRQDEFSQPND